MNIPPLAPDLTKQAPRSPRDRLAGFVIAKRTLDKCRADLAGKLGDYHYDCPLDNKLFAFKGINGEQFKAAVRNAKSDEEVGAWLLSSGMPRTASEIATWSSQIEAIRPGGDPDRPDSFDSDCEKFGLDPKTATLFDWLEGDDRTSFRKAGAKVPLTFNS